MRKVEIMWQLSVYLCSLLLPQCAEAGLQSRNATLSNYIH